ncbi:uncharacterized protein LOC131856792 [Cryptomeria japonica]|uniref:uncharacterized protein LOC131856792 n=1 Tax=Cryptomeria japonica TaxID=3369 RepID=UPI0027DA4A38|nr:uncharacterized protein LOC131856792 [Cryptomeria japonica]
MQPAEEEFNLKKAKRSQQNHRYYSKHKEDILKRRRLARLNCQNLNPLQASFTMNTINTPPTVLPNENIHIHNVMPAAASATLQQTSLHSIESNKTAPPQESHSIYHYAILQNTNPQQSTINCFSSTEYIEALKNFCARIDSLSTLQMCSICEERYIGMVVQRSHPTIICSRCFSERGIHHFSLANNLDPGEQPLVLKKLTQVEEMLIAHISTVLQVTHARGSQYKYFGHTISFPQDISEIAKKLPCKLQDLEVLIIQRINIQGNKYDCYVNKFHVMDALTFKIQHDQYYKDVIIDFDSFNLLPDVTTDVSAMLNMLQGIEIEIVVPPIADYSNAIDPFATENSSSFIPTMLGTTHELEAIKDTLQLHTAEKNLLPWPQISSSPINENNTKGLLPMAFPTLFPTGVALPLQTHPKHVHLHKYALHLIRYYDQMFGQHVRFWYFIYNLIMCHRSQQSAAVFIRTNIEEAFPSNLQALRERLQSTPDDHLPKQLLRFGATLRGTRAYWNKSRKEFTAMISQLGTPTLFFTLSLVDTKWPDLHTIFNEDKAQQIVENVIRNPHITTLYLHNRFTIFHEEIIQKLFKAKDLWYRYEWQHRGSTHIHGFLWLPGAPNMDIIDWHNDNEVHMAKRFFDTYVSAWNPRTKADRNNTVSYAAIDDPCLADTAKIFSMSPTTDYEALVNTLERHTKCTQNTCLRKKGNLFKCRYKAPWPEQQTSTLTIDTNNKPCYTPTRNDDHLNIHSPCMLSIWRANIDCQSVTSRKAVLQYISKYASKSEK